MPVIAVIRRSTVTVHTMASGNSRPESGRIMVTWHTEEIYMYIRQYKVLWHLGSQLGIGDSIALAQVVTLTVKGNTVAQARCNVAVEAVVRDVCLRADEPLHLDWAVVHVEVESTIYIL